MAGKVKNIPVITVAAVAASPARSGYVRRRLAVKFGRRDRPEVAHLPVRRVYLCGGRWCLVWSDLSRLSNDQKVQLGSRFGELLPRVFGVQKVSWGLGFHLESHTMFI